MLSNILLPHSKINTESSKPTFFNQTFTDSDQMPDLNSSDATLICASSSLTDNVRKSIEKFQNHFKNIVITDCGKFNNDALGNLSDHFQNIIDQKHIPIFFGFNKSDILDFCASSGCATHFISNNLPLIESDHVLDKTYIGFQRHLCSLPKVQMMEEHSSNSVSLGRMRSNPSILEPILRDAEFLFLDLNSVRTSDAPNTTDSLPSGLNAEELCQITRFAGTSDKIKAVFICADIETTLNNAESNLIAESIWYFLEGLNMKTKDHPSVNTDFSEYMVFVNDLELDVAFVRNNLSHKWWLKTKPEDSVIWDYFPCAYEEYQLTIQNETPDRILKHLSGH